MQRFSVSSTAQALKTNVAKWFAHVQDAYHYVHATIRASDASYPAYGSLLEQSIRSPIHLGAVVLAIAFCFFILWGSLAPLDSAAIAPGSVVLSANRKTVQHLEGGIIDKIYVKDGDFVEKGQTLLTLNEKSPKARYNVLHNQLITSQILEARLIAERIDQEQFDAQKVADSLLTSSNTTGELSPEIKEAIKIQQELYASRQSVLHGQLDVIDERIHQHLEQINGLEKQFQSFNEQKRIADEELATLTQLYKKRLAQKPKLQALQRDVKQLEAKTAEIQTQIAHHRETIAENKQHRINTKNEFIKEVIAELREVQTSLGDLKEQLHAAEDIVSRTHIQAPEAGIITGLKYHTQGGVITPGTAILDIIPQDDDLIIEAKVNPLDINLVHPGQEAKVQLSAFKRRLVPRIKGEVIYVAADRFDDPAKGNSYYTVRVRIHQEELSRLTADVQLYPGMPADIYIKTGSRTLLGYLLSPLRDSFYKAFREA